MLNDSRGTFVDAAVPRLQPLGDHTTSLGAVDFDGDGDIDLVIGSITYDNVAPTRIEFNLLRHLKAPTPPTIGQSFAVEVYARHGAPNLFDVAFPFVATAPAAIRLPPLGTLRLDPTAAAELPPFVIPSTTGSGVASFPIPANPGLVGLELFGQAVLVPGSSTPRFTNAFAHTIRW